MQLKIFAFGLAGLMALALVQGRKLPATSELVSALLNDPAQAAVVLPSFNTSVNRVTYAVQPLHTYEIWGMVVSKHNSDAWWDWFHSATNDHLNVTDLCLVWGSNVRSGSYQAISFSSGQWTCNYETGSDDAFKAFDQTSISNNHLLTDNPAIARKLRKVRTGDQLRIRGHLAEYRHSVGMDFFRGTSTVRGDTGNGACETLFVTDVEVLKSASSFWRLTAWGALAGLFACLAVWWRRPYRARSE